MFASGYRINAGTSVNGTQKVKQLRLRCTEITRHQSTLFPLVGDPQGSLFAETLSCSGDLTSDPRLYMGEIFMNKAGDGMNATCMRQ